MHQFPDNFCLPRLLQMRMRPLQARYIRERRASKRWWHPQVLLLAGASANIVIHLVFSATG